MSVSKPTIIICSVLLCIFIALLYPYNLFVTPWSFVLEDKHGELLGARIAADGQWRFPLSKKVPQKFCDAIVAFEDSRFYYHLGIDPCAIVRALRINVKAGKIKSGASTIPMQVIRLSRKGQPRTVLEKIIEMVLALKLSITSSKGSVLSLYASQAPFGGNVVGLEAAAWRYFGRDPTQLSWAEIATLAVLPNEPSLVHPGKNRNLLLQKRNTLLKKLYEHNKLDRIGFLAAKDEPLVTKPHDLPNGAPHLLDRAIKDQKNNKRVVYRIRSTIDKQYQERICALVAQHQLQLISNGIFNSAVLVLSVKTGQAIVYVGNSQDSNLRHGDHGNNVDIITAPRSTGSVLKPFLYAAMLDAGDLLPTTLIPDIPTTIGGFSPENFNREYSGAVPASLALARSLNIPAVRMVQQYGISRFKRMLCSIGLTNVNRSSDNYGISIILGGAEGTLWDLCGAYASISRKVLNYQDANVSGTMSFFRPSYDFSTQKNISYSAKSLDPLSAAACFCALDAMVEVTRPREEGTWKDFSSSVKIAWKTGTSFGFRDGWAIGCSKEYVVGVWTGNASGEGRPGLIGIETAAPLLFNVFSVFKSTKWFSKPEAELFNVTVCAKSGYRNGPYCDILDTLLIPELGMQTKVCPYHQLVHLDKSGHYRVSDKCQPVTEMQHRAWFILPPAMEYYYRQMHTEYMALPPLRGDCTEGVEKNAIGLLYPHSKNAEIYIPLEADGNRGRAVFEAIHRDPKAILHWHIDTEYLGSTTGFHQLAVAPSPGNHTLLLLDNNGERLSVPFVVLSKD